MKCPLVYVVVLNYRGWADTIECLDSVFRLDYPNFRVVLVDNASPDGSVARLADWLDGKQTHRLAANHPLRAGSVATPPPAYQRLAPEDTPTDVPLYFLPRPTNTGFAGGNNVGLRLALRQGADYVWLLNNDTVTAPDALTRLVARAAAEGAGLCGSTLRYYHAPEVVQAQGGRFCYPLALGLNQRAGRPASGRPPANADYVVGASCLAPSAFLRDVGLLAEDYFLYYEEIDWAVCARRQGWRIAHAFESVVYHKEGGAISPGGSEKSELADFHSFRSRLLFVRKHYPYYLPLVLLSFGGVALNRLRRGQVGRLRLIARAVGEVLSSSRRVPSSR